jgi:hypothetical protein
VEASKEELEELRYPIGRFRPLQSYTMENVNAEIDRIEAAPAALGEALKGLKKKQLDTPYRADGWTVRQVVHHLADSHINGYCRVKLALTEEVPRIRPYREAKWAELGEAREGDHKPSLRLLKELHTRWVMSLRSLTPDQLSRALIHPDVDAPFPIPAVLSLYAWHGEHHVAHVTRLREREGW